jgi:hypothetical protein
MYIGKKGNMSMIITLVMHYYFVSPSKEETPSRSARFLAVKTSAWFLAVKTSAKEGDIPKIEGCMHLLDNLLFCCYLFAKGEIVSQSNSVWY